MVVGGAAGILWVEANSLQCTGQPFSKDSLSPRCEQGKFQRPGTVVAFEEEGGEVFSSVWGSRVMDACPFPWR